MIRYNIQAAYEDITPRTELIQATNRINRRIDLQRSKELIEAQSAGIRQKKKIQKLRDRREELFQRIRQQFIFIYRAERQAIYDQYKKIKRIMNRKIKTRERELMNQIQKEYNIVAPVQDMRAQLKGDPKSLRLILSISKRVRYIFIKRSRIAKAFFNPSSTRDVEDDVN